MFTTKRTCEDYICIYAIMNGKNYSIKK